MWPCLFSLKFHFHEKMDGRWFSSHDEGPASTDRFTGGQVITKSTSASWLNLKNSNKREVNFIHSFLPYKDGPENDPPSSTVAYITLITRVFWPFLGGVIIFIIFMIQWGDVFFDKSSTFIKKGTGDDFRLMTRVLPRPLVLQGGKLFAYQDVK